LSRRAIPESLISQIKAQRATGASIAQIVKSLGVSFGVVQKHCKDPGLRQSDLAEPGPRPDPMSQRTFSESGDEAQLTYTTPHRVRTEADALEYGEIDPAVWAVESMQVSSWEVVAKSEDLVEDVKGKIWKIKEPKRHHLWGVKLKLKRIMPKPYLDAVKGVFDSLKPPPLPKTIRVKKSDGVMLMMGLFDVHFGKLGLADECGEDYNLALAEKVYANAVEDLLNRISHIRPEKILWPIGNDFVHIDNKRNETTRGTVVSTDGRMTNIIRVAFRAQYLGFAMASQVCPVEGFYLPGNHDELAAYYAALNLEAGFRGSNSVSIDVSPASRKYRTYGDTMLGFTHGHKLKAKDLNKLAGIMMSEQRDNLRGTKWSEWFTGHGHRKQTYEDTFQGTTVHAIQSLSGPDDYHFDEGFVGARRAAEVYCYEKSGGYCGHWIATARH
jgi:hypothetical protein